MNTLLKAITICALAISAVAQDTECNPENLPTFCPTAYNPCCAYLCGVPGGQPACRDQNITETGENASGARRVTCELCPTDLSSFPRASSTSETPAAAETTTAGEEGTAGYDSTVSTTVPEPSTTLEPVPTGNYTGNGTQTTGLPEPTYSSGASSVIAIGSAP
ncbi:hypothetical protein TWF718_002572 [Orbilia javanica]|uniref:Uncharacterized protein n=1 Tax=Orbilia javanica TaxID=47235 RepID=A0AAN8MHV7_9PEZI